VSDLALVAGHLVPPHGRYYFIKSRWDDNPGAETAKGGLGRALHTCRLTDSIVYGGLRRLHG
jgi:hypothetical protein